MGVCMYVISIRHQPMKTWSRWQQVKEAAYHENIRDVYATIRNLLGKYSKPERPVKEKDKLFNIARYLCCF